MGGNSGIGAGSGMQNFIIALNRSVARPTVSSITASAGTSINPAPCAVAIRKDQSAMPAWPARVLISSLCPAPRRAANGTPPLRRAARRPGPECARGPSTSPAQRRPPRSQPTRRARCRLAAEHAALAPRRAPTRRMRRRTSSRSPGSIHAGRRGRQSPATASS